MPALHLSRSGSVLLDRAVELTGCGSWLWQPETGAISWSQTVYELFDVAPDVSPTLELLLERTHPDDRATLIAELDAATASGTLGPVDFRVVHSDGSVRHLRGLGRVDVTGHGRAGELVGAVQDRTESSVADREIAAHVAVSEALTEPDWLGAGSEQLLRSLAGALDFTVGALWLPADLRLVRDRIWSATGNEPPGLAVGATVRLGQGLTGWAAAERRPVTLRDLPPRLWAADTRTAADAGLCGGVAIPALTDDDVLAVIELRCTEPEWMPDRLTNSLLGVAHQLGAFLARRRGELAPPLLTGRELEVLGLTATGLSGPGIAERLTISPATAKTHLEHIYAKLGVPDRASAVARGLRDGLIR